ncbi:MAG: S24/S26 family peptidase [Desulfovibrionaceae bacterium]|nr:S24/S26 family peptidase [Desulfovibrionaceae bacterium]
MTFTDDVRDALLARIGKGRLYANNKRMADDLEVDPSQLNRFLKRERGLNAESLGRILDRLGARLLFADEPAEASLEVCFSPPGATCADKGAKPAQAGDYLAVPLVSPAAAAGQGRIPEEAVRGWILVWKHHENILFRTNLVAVQVPKNDESMAPALHPGDIVIVDRNDREPLPAGKIMLVREPGAPGRDAEALIRRVNTGRLDEDIELVFYSDNGRQFPPLTFCLNRDYGGDIARAVAGNVIWAMSDMTKK